MINDLIANLQALLLDAFGKPWAVCLALSLLPIVEARLAIPMAFAYGYGGIAPLLIGYVGSTIIAPLLLITLLPLINAISALPVFGRLCTGFLKRAGRQSDKILRLALSDGKKMLGVFSLVALPLPFTGVWTGCAVASLCKIGFKKSLIAIAAGNLTSSLIIFILCCLFPISVINCIIAVMGVIVLCLTAVMLVRAFTVKNT